MKQAEPSPLSVVPKTLGPALSFLEGVAIRGQSIKIEAHGPRAVKLTSAYVPHFAIVANISA